MKSKFHLHCCALDGIHFRLKRQWQERLARSDAYYLRLADTILKDISRTDQHISFLKSRTVRSLIWIFIGFFFNDSERRSNLFNVMMTYSVYHPDPGYCQGKLLRNDLEECSLLINE